MSSTLLGISWRELVKQHHSSSDNHNEHTPDNQVRNERETYDTTKAAGNAGEPTTPAAPATSLADIAHEWLVDQDRKSTRLNSSHW